MSDINEAMVLALLDAAEAGNKEQVEAIASLSKDDLAGLETGKRMKNAPVQKGHTRDAPVLGIDDENRVVTYVMSTEDEDRDGETVNPEGGDFSQFQINRVVSFNHDTDTFPVGKLLKWWNDYVGEGTEYDTIPGPKRMALLGNVYFSKENPQGDLAFRMVKEGTLGGGSISFLPDGETSKNAKGGNHYDHWKLLEFAICSLGSNPYAVAMAVAKRFRGASSKSPVDAMKRVASHFGWTIGKIGSTVWTFIVPDGFELKPTLDKELNDQGIRGARATLEGNRLIVTAMAFPTKSNKTFSLARSVAARVGHLRSKGISSSLALHAALGELKVPKAMRPAVKQLVVKSDLTVPASRLKVGDVTDGYGRYKVVAISVHHTTAGGKKIYEITLESTQKESSLPVGSRLVRQSSQDQKWGIERGLNKQLVEKGYDWRQLYYPKYLVTHEGKQGGKDWWTINHTFGTFWSEADAQREADKMNEKFKKELQVKYPEKRNKAIATRRDGKWIVVGKDGELLDDGDKNQGFSDMYTAQRIAREWTKEGKHQKADQPLLDADGHKVSIGDTVGLSGRFFKVTGIEGARLTLGPTDNPNLPTGSARYAQASWVSLYKGAKAMRKIWVNNKSAWILKSEGDLDDQTQEYLEERGLDDVRIEDEPPPTKSEPGSEEWVEEEREEPEHQEKGKGSFKWLQGFNANRIHHLPRTAGNNEDWLDGWDHAETSPKSKELPDVADDEDVAAVVADRAEELKDAGVDEDSAVEASMEDEKVPMGKRKAVKRLALKRLVEKGSGTVKFTLPNGKEVDIPVAGFIASGRQALARKYGGKPMDWQLATTPKPGNGNEFVAQFNGKNGSCEVRFPIPTSGGIGPSPSTAQVGALSEYKSKRKTMKLYTVKCSKGFLTKDLEETDEPVAMSADDALETATKAKAEGMSNVTTGQALTDEEEQPTEFEGTKSKGTSDLDDELTVPGGDLSAAEKVLKGQLEECVDRRMKSEEDMPLEEAYKCCGAKRLDKRLMKKLWPHVKAAVKRKSFDPSSGPTGKQALDKLIKSIEDDMKSLHKSEQGDAIDAMQRTLKELKKTRKRVYGDDEEQPVEMDLDTEPVEEEELVVPTKRKKLEIEFDKKPGKRYPLNSDSDSEYERTAKQAGMWKGGSEPFPHFTVYRDGQEIGGGGDKSLRKNVRKAPDGPAGEAVEFLDDAAEAPETPKALKQSMKAVSAMLKGMGDEPTDDDAVEEGLRTMKVAIKGGDVPADFEEPMREAMRKLMGVRNKAFQVGDKVVANETGKEGKVVEVGNAQGRYNTYGPAVRVEFDDGTSGRFVRPDTSLTKKSLDKGTSDLDSDLSVPGSEIEKAEDDEALEMACKTAEDVADAPATPKRLGVVMRGLAMRLRKAVRVNKEKPLTDEEEQPTEFEGTKRLKGTSDLDSDLSVPGSEIEKDAAEAMDDMADAGDTPKRYKATLRYLSRKLKGLDEEDEQEKDIGEEEEEALQKALGDLRNGRFGLRESYFRNTAQRM